MRGRRPDIDMAIRRFPDVDASYDRPDEEGTLVSSSGFSTPFLSPRCKNSVACTSGTTRAHAHMMWPSLRGRDRSACGDLWERTSSASRGLAGQHEMGVDPDGA
ncbi:hypothetical protein ABZZ80_39440, partial [Streptomyces sp. NPDC006356]